MPYTPMNERKRVDGFGRIQVDVDAPDIQITDIKNPITLTSSVGNSGQNTRRDVAKVETVLDQVGALDLKQTDGPTGYWGTRTADATKKVQADHGLKADAEINPIGPTIKTLTQLTKPTKSKDKPNLPLETPEIKPPNVAPNMPVFDKPLPQWDFRTLPYVDEHGNIVVEGENSKTKKRIRPPKGPI